MFKKKTIKSILLGVLLVGIAAAIYFYKEYNRMAADLTDTTPVTVTDATALTNQYEQDEDKANQQYLGKTIQVSGFIAEINNQQDTLINVVIGDKDAMHKVSGLIDKRHLGEIKKYETGHPITIKGICTGYLLDVELNQCVIVPVADK